MKLAGQYRLLKKVDPAIGPQLCTSQPVERELADFFTFQGVDIFDLGEGYAYVTGDFDIGQYRFISITESDTPIDTSGPSAPPPPDSDTTFFLYDMIARSDCRIAKESFQRFTGND